ncbi:amidohydrolase [Piscibacillus halophilus]|uniref:Aminobenzoyl-glutamate utilization protein A n=1 Tax=Piscibacillus halophilus TaxID=571933 RepID=A0A1H9HMK5_9BACI|nr:amidohydrolase [Piscibacillus halophilus]SEQ63486.1 aminobenzoyl-glutamate utilization protein A [Piscibacillus halophilus]
MDHSAFLKSLEGYLVEKRREFHRYPEVGFTEYVTTHRIVEELKDLDFTLTVGKDALVSEERYGVPSAEVLSEAEERAASFGVPSNLLDQMRGGNTGVVAVLDTGNPGPHVAMRFDIDALPILESDEDNHVPTKEGFKSERPGEMHACGHDGHTAIGLGVAKYLHQFKEELKGTFTLLFQPAEEGGRGAKAMVAKGWLDDVDYFLSGHLGIGEHEAGMVAATTSRFLASAKLNVHFKGKSAHAGVEPNVGRNALLAAASASLHLHNIPRHKDGATRVNVGRLVAGSGRNVIADTAFMEMETRGETTELNEYMQTEAKRIIQASGDLYNVETDIEFMGEALNGNCDPEFIDWVKKANEHNPYVKEVYDVQELGASEDVTFMMKRVQERGGKATFMVFPSPLPAGHHHPKFDVDEYSLITAVSTFINIIRFL